MKKHVKPLCKIVKLASEQCVLQICQLNALYFVGTTQCQYDAGVHGGSPACPVSVKGYKQNGLGTFPRTTQENMPS